MSKDKAFNEAYIIASLRTSLLSTIPRLILCGLFVSCLISMSGGN